MKVLHVYRTCFPETKGGVEQVIRFISTGAQQYGVETKILSLSDEHDKAFLHDGSEIILKKKSWEIASNGFSLGLISEFKKLAEWADIIHYHYPWPTGDILNLFDKNTPSVLTYHSDIVRQKFLKVLYSPLERYFLKHVTRIAPTSPQYVASSKTLSEYKDKIEVIPLGIDPSAYGKCPDELIETWKNSVGDSFFLFVGVLRYYKGLEFLIKAAEINRLPVVIAGDGPLRKELESLVREKGLANVKFVGFISEEDKVALLNLCQAFVFPSHLRSEAFGVSLLEAQLFKKAIISCDVGTGSSYVNIDGETGLVVEKENYQQISDAMITLNENMELRQQLGKNGYERFNNLFTAEILTKSYYKLYTSLLNTN
ncbi:glycosyltransferase [Vibrio sp. JC009]|uniref:glycosyltransferase n=1 Tax=Vibrio sp. JC009 TaxID=2912314 RepID=UPI0023AF38FC|nr:glycosyltransferase [Vibrio sp. JC009]WED22022.1 glycosyltransferase [Vibrio sp. JC009]